MEHLRSRPYKTEAINLRVQQFGEADKLMTFFSPDYGKIKTIAKGARKPGSKFGGRLEIFAYNNLLLAAGKEFSILSQIETIENFKELREDIDKLKAGIYFIRLVDAGTEVGQKNEDLFNLILESLYLLKDSFNKSLLTKIFEIKFMDVEGFFPTLDKCVSCSKKVTVEPKKIKFNLSRGGILCSQCSKKIFGGIEMPYEAVKVISTIKNENFKDLEKYKINEKLLEEIDLIVRPYLSENIGYDIKELRRGI